MQCDKIWCTFDGVSSATIIFQWCWMGVLLLLVVLLGFWVWLRRRAKQQYSLVQYLILYGYLLYSVVSTIKCVINIKTYGNDDVNDVEVMSYIYLMLNYFSALISTTYLFIIPITWLRKALLQVNEENLNIYHRNYLNQTFKVLKGVKIFTLVRVLVVVFSMVTVFVTKKPYFALIASFIFSYEAILLIMIYGWGMKVVKRLAPILKIAPEVVKTLMREYTGLMVVAICRILFNESYDSFDPCRQSCWVDTQQIPKLILLVGAGITTHLVPLLLILYIYWPPKLAKQSEHEQLIHGYQSI